MPALDPARARDLLLRVVQKSYAEGHSPLPGAFVKAQMLVEAQQDGALFNERELGFKRFIEFVRTIPEIAIQGRSGSDVLLAPATATELLSAYASPLPRLRRDFWRAFFEFPAGALREHRGFKFWVRSQMLCIRSRRILASVRSSTISSTDSRLRTCFNYVSRLNGC